MKKAITLMVAATFILAAMDLMAWNNSSKGVKAIKYKSATSLMRKKSTERNNPIKPAGLTEMAGMRKITSGNEMLPSAIVFQGWDEFTQEWYNQAKFNYTYVNGTNEHEVIIEMIMDDEWYPTEKHIYVYNDMWILQEIEIYYYVDFTKSWELSARELMHTDSYGNLILEASLMLDAANMVWDTLSGSKYEYTYTAFGEPEEIITSYYDLFMPGWMYSYKQAYEYDNFSRVSEFTEFYWDDLENGFVPEYKEDYYYNSDNEWEEAWVYYWLMDEWNLNYKISDIQWFDFASRKHLFYIAYMPGFEPGTWEPYFRSTANYHPILEEQTYLFEEYYDNWLQIWLPDYRETTVFDENQLPVLTLMEYYFEEQWWVAFGLRNTYVMNAQGFIMENISEVYDGFDTFSWINWMKQIFEYDQTTGSPSIKNPVDMVKFYPNPVNDYAFFAMDKQFPIISVDVMNSQGQVVMNNIFRSYEQQAPLMMDMRMLQPGIYFLHVQAGGNRQTMKIVKR